MRRYLEKILVFTLTSVSVLAVNINLDEKDHRTGGCLNSGQEQSNKISGEEPAVRVKGSGNVYYVDIESREGQCSDDNPGTLSKPFCSIQKAADVVRAGDTILVREGIYHEKVTFKNSGSKLEGYITFKAYPREKPILEGTVKLTGWTQSAPSEPGLTVNGVTNPNYANIYKAQTKVEIDIDYLLLLEDGQLLQIAQAPDQNNIVFDDTDYYVPITDSNNFNQQNYLWDPSNLNQADDYWIGAFVKIWSHKANNRLLTRRIVDFDSSEGRLTFDKPLSHKVVERDKYSITNHPHILDKPGEYYITSNVDGTHTIYLWPRKIADLADKISISVLSVGFYPNAKSYVIIDGFEIRGFSGGGTRVGGINNPFGFHHENLIIRNNKIYNIRGYGGIIIKSGNDDVIENNVVYNIQEGGRGILVTKGNNVIARNNIVYNTGSTSIDFYTITNGQMIGNNIGAAGTHGNGLTTYRNCLNILVANNEVIGANTAFTMSNSSNIYLYNNIFHGTKTYIVAAWGAMSGKIAILNNVILGSSNHASLLTTSADEMIVKNNILDGGGGGDRSHNIYVGLKWDQHSSHGWYPAEGEIVETDLSKIFVDPHNHNYELKEGSPAINAGVDVSKYLPTEIFPDFDFNTDIKGNLRDSNPDIGAYEYVGAFLIFNKD